MTLEEQKLAVCEKLNMITMSGLYIKWNNGQIVNWPTEGLQVCHEAEKLIDSALFVNDYRETLYNICGNGIAAINATYEQRLEALCLVWFPERFK